MERCCCYSSSAARWNNAPFLWVLKIKVLDVESWMSGLSEFVWVCVNRWDDVFPAEMWCCFFHQGQTPDITYIWLLWRNNINQTDRQTARQASICPTYGQRGHFLSCKLRVMDEVVPPWHNLWPSRSQGDLHWKVLCSNSLQYISLRVVSTFFTLHLCFVFRYFILHQMCCVFKYFILHLFSCSNTSVYIWLCFVFKCFTLHLCYVFIYFTLLLTVLCVQVLHFTSKMDFWWSTSVYI